MARVRVSGQRIGVIEVAGPRCVAAAAEIVGGGRRGLAAGFRLAGLGRRGRLGGRLGLGPHERSGIEHLAAIIGEV